jgi:hypothetical protein
MFGGRAYIEDEIFALDPGAIERSIFHELFVIAGALKWNGACRANADRVSAQNERTLLDRSIIDNFF